MIGEYIDRETGERHGEIEMKGKVHSAKFATIQHTGNRGRGRESCRDMH